MTDKDIIKALECCISSGDCKGCPSYIEKDDDCLGIKWVSILDLINRLQAENERLKRLLDEEEKKYNLCAKRFYKDGVKEYAKRCKECFPSIAGAFDCFTKEMVGEE